MKRYHSGYFIKFGSESFSPKEYSDNLIDDPSLKLIPSNYNADTWTVEWVYSNKWNGLEFIIVTDSFETAQNALFNVLCSAAVIEGNLTWSNEAHYPHEFGTIENSSTVDTLNRPIKGFSSDSIPEYFHLAALASKDYKLENSIIKYQLSTEIYSQHFMDLHEVINWKTTDYRFIQMRFAYAIISAFSVIEELGLNVNVNVSVNKRSKLENGEWDKEVLDDLIERLIKSGVNVKEDVSWMIRGKETKIESKRPIKLTKTAEWADKEDSEDYDYFDTLKVNDGYVSFPDAINHISFLRSSISSHSVGKRIMDLSVFDVANAQHLARRLILEKTNRWK